MISQLYIASDSLQILTRGYVENVWLQAVTGLLLLGAFAWAANWVAKRIVLTLLLRLIDHLPFRVEAAHIGAVVARFGLLRTYLHDKQDDLSRWNVDHAADNRLDSRRLTNIGTFRAYVLAYLRANPNIRPDQTLLVRQLAPSEHGLPLEIYAFANTIVWAEYEGIQADIFDHLIAILPEFGLRLFQRPAGSDLGQLMSGTRLWNGQGALEAQALCQVG